MYVAEIASHFPLLITKIFYDLIHTYKTSYTYETFLSRAFGLTIFLTNSSNEFKL